MMWKNGRIGVWVLVQLLGVLFMVVGTLELVKAQTGGCPQMQGVCGGWGPWGSCNPSSQQGHQGHYHCVRYEYPDTCVSTSSWTKCEPYGKDPSYEWAECNYDGVRKVWTCSGIPAGRDPGSLTHYDTFPCP